jgi:phosphatidylinositol 4-phosphatase
MQFRTASISSLELGFPGKDPRRQCSFWLTIDRYLFALYDRSFYSSAGSHHANCQVPYVTSFSLFMICAGLTLPRTSGVSDLFLVSPLTDNYTSLDYGLYYYFIFWFILFSISLIFIFIHGIEYVSWPRLIPLTNIIYYGGPGYRSAHHGKGIGGTQRIAKTLTVSKAGRRRAASRLEEIEMGTKKRVD